MKSTLDQLSIRQLLLKLWRHLPPRRRKQYLLILALMLVSAFAEVLSLGALLPFLGVMIAPDQIMKYSLVKDILNFLGIAANQLAIFLTLIFIVAAVIAGGLRFVLLNLSTRLAYACGADLSNEVYRRTLYQPYQVHVSRNSSDVISSLTSKINGVVFGVLNPILVFISSFVMTLSIVATLLAVDLTIALIAGGSFGFCYALIAVFTRKKLKANGAKIAEEETKVVRALQEGLGGIRDVLLDGTQDLYVNVYRQSELPMRAAQGNNIVMGQSPRYLMEVLAMLMIALLALFLSTQEGGVGAAMPVLGTLAFGAQRLLPAFQQLFHGWTSIVGSRSALISVLDLLDQSPPQISFDALPVIEFGQQIEFEHIYFKYDADGPWILEDFNLVIKKGSRIGLVGSTGSGKSTVLDLLMGLLTPTQGIIKVDNRVLKGDSIRSWQRCLAHVPQSIFLSDASIAQNIAFGTSAETIDYGLIRLAAQQAQLADFIEMRPGAYDAMVGERGVRLSGGQRQRIGIARALYKQARVLIFDEATSALDSATESSVMDSIRQLNKNLTIVMVAHRLSTVRDCDCIIEMAKGKVVAQGSYDELLANSQSFRALAKDLSVRDFDNGE